MLPLLSAILHCEDFSQFSRTTQRSQDIQLSLEVKHEQIISKFVHFKPPLGRKDTLSQMQ